MQQCQFEGDPRENHPCLDVLEITQYGQCHVIWICPINFNALCQRGSLVWLETLWEAPAINFQTDINCDTIPTLL